MQKQKIENNLTPIVRESIEEQVYKILKKQILEKHIEHGTRLIQDNLAKELGTSRIPIRQALQRLVTDRLLKQNNRGHYFVQTISKSDIDEIYNIRIIIETKNVIAMKITKKVPMFDSAKAWTEDMIPLLVINVPKIQRENVRILRKIFQSFISPRLFCKINVWIRAVPVSQGMNDAFSTGSHAQ